MWLSLCNKTISVPQTTKFGSANYGYGVCACWRGAAVPKPLVNTLRMFALLRRTPSCVRRRARPGAGACALARAPARERARARMCMRALTYRCKTCKKGVFIKERVCTVRVQGSAPKSVPFPDPKNGVKAFRKSQVRLQKNNFCRMNNFLVCT